jgi:anti-sigma factor RsiW
MRCHEAEGLLAPQFSDSLDAVTQRELALHLDSCAACRARLQMEYELDRLIIAEVDRGSPPDGLVVRIEQQLEAQRAPWLLSWWRWPALAGAMATVLLFALVFPRFTAGGRMHLLCKDAVDDHRSEVVMRQAITWHTGSEISDLVRRTVPRAQIPQTVAGLSLQKARICDLLQAPALHLVYGNGAQQVSVFFLLPQDLPSGSLPPPAAASNRLHQENDSGIAVASFTGKGVGVVVVGNQGITGNVAGQIARSL